MNQTIIGSLCWIFNEDRVLMLKRNKPPHMGMLVAPGGTLKTGESPIECAVREIREETGLRIPTPRLRGIVSVLDLDALLHWLLFIYKASSPEGNLADRIDDEGQLSWEKVDEYANLQMAKTDRLYLEWTINHTGVFQAKIEYQDTTGIFRYDIL